MKFLCFNKYETKNRNTLSYQLQSRNLVTFSEPEISLRKLPRIERSSFEQSIHKAILSGRFSFGFTSDRRTEISKTICPIYLVLQINHAWWHVPKLVERISLESGIQMIKIVYVSIGQKSAFDEQLNFCWPFNLNYHRAALLPNVSRL